MTWGGLSWSLTSNLISMGKKHHNQNQLRKGFISSCGLSCGEVRTGTQGRTLEAGIDAEAMEDWYCLACSSFLVQSAFLEHSYCQQVVAAVIWSLLCQSSTKQMSHRLAYRPVLSQLRFFLHLEFLLILSWQKKKKKKQKQPGQAPMPVFSS